MRRTVERDSAVLSEISTLRLGLIAGGCPLNWVWKAVSNYSNINQALACYHKVNLSGGAQKQLEVPSSHHALGQRGHKG